MDKETELLSRLAANHLHLAQFEPLRATLLALRSKNPDLALTILQTIVANSGRFENILCSPSCPSPSLLTYLSTLELLQYSNSTSRTWSFDPGILRLRAEFLLLVQVLIDTVSDKSGEFGDCLSVLNKVLELGVKRLKPDIRVDNNDAVNEEQKSERIEEEEIMCLQRVVLENADVFEALCWNINQQLKGDEVESSGLAIAVRRDDNASMNVVKNDEFEEEVVKVFNLIQRSVQLAHLYAMKESLEVGNEEAFSHIRYLQLDRGVDEAEYRYV